MAKRGWREGQWSVRSAETHRFVPRDYQGPVEIFVNGKWEYAGRGVRPTFKGYQSGKREIPAEEKPLKIKTAYDKGYAIAPGDVGRNTIEYYAHTRMTANRFVGQEYAFTKEKLDAHVAVEKTKKEISTDDKFVFSEKAARRLGLDEEQQYKIWETFRAANIEGKRIEEETGGEIKVSFSYNLDHWRVDERTLLARLNAAQKVLEGDWLDQRAQESIENVIEAIENYTDAGDIEFSDFKDYIKGQTIAEAAREILGNANKLDLYMLMHKYHWESLPYAWDSIITKHGYEFLMNEISDLLQRAKRLRH